MASSEATGSPLSWSGGAGSGTVGQAAVESRERASRDFVYKRVLVED